MFVLPEPHHANIRYAQSSDSSDPWRPSTPKEFKHATESGSKWVPAQDLVP